MDIGRPLRELVAEPVVDPVPVDVPQVTSVAIDLASSRPDRGPHGAVGGPDDPGAPSPARV